MTSIGRRIREVREAKGWSQEALATSLPVSLNMVGRWERDEAIPRGSTGLRLAEALGVSYDWLRTGLGAREAPRPLAKGVKELPGANHIPGAWLLLKEVLARRGLELGQEQLSDLFVDLAQVCLEENRAITEADVVAALVRLITEA
jgi:transcriptional regulator with XRE-family HTH domain